MAKSEVPEHLVLTIHTGVDWGWCCIMLLQYCNEIIQPKFSTMPWLNAWRGDDVIHVWLKREGWRGPVGRSGDNIK